MLYDNYGRPTINLRVSLTQRCNYRCSYCHHEGELSPSNEMTTEEILRIVKIAVSLGMSKVKLTGGEPLLREDILEIVKGISEISGIVDLSMTTNGSLLGQLARELCENGLMRVNINFPSLNSEVYKELTGGNIDEVIAGIKEAVNVGLYPVKLNMLVLRGINDKEIPEMIDFARENKVILQLIELEPINIDSAYYLNHHYSLDDIENELKKQAYKVKTRKYMHNRRIYFLQDVKVEVIHPIENTEFCMHCTRLRVTSDGKLKPCLMRNDNLVDILTPMRKGASDEELKLLFMEAVRRREPYYKGDAIKRKPK